MNEQDQKAELGRVLNEKAWEIVHRPTGETYFIRLSVYDYVLLHYSARICAWGRWDNRVLLAAAEYISTGHSSANLRSWWEYVLDGEELAAEDYFWSIAVYCKRLEEYLNVGLGGQTANWDLYFANWPVDKWGLPDAEREVVL